MAREAIQQAYIYTRRCWLESPTPKAWMQPRGATSYSGLECEPKRRMRVWALVSLTVPGRRPHQDDNTKNLTARDSTQERALKNISCVQVCNRGGRVYLRDLLERPHNQTCHNTPSLHALKCLTSHHWEMGRNIFNQYPYKVPLMDHE